MQDNRGRLVFSLLKPILLSSHMGALQLEELSHEKSYGA